MINYEDAMNIIEFPEDGLSFLFDIAGFAAEESFYLCECDKDDIASIGNIDGETWTAARYEYVGFDWAEVDLLSSNGREYTLAGDKDDLIEAIAKYATAMD